MSGHSILAAHTPKQQRIEVTTPSEGEYGLHTIQMKSLLLLLVVIVALIIGYSACFAHDGCAACDYHMRMTRSPLY